MLLNNRINNQQKTEIWLDVIGGRNSESTPAQSLFRCVLLSIYRKKLSTIDENLIITYNRIWIKN